MNDPRDSDSPFGVLDFLSWNHDWNHYHYIPESLEKALDLMREAGVGFVRMDFLWSDIESTRGTFDFKKYDLIVDSVSRRGIKILGLLLYSPAWKGELWNQAPAPDLFTRYAREVVRRYRDRIKHWEIWNEPDHATYWQPQDALRSYSLLLKQVYPILKEEDPTSVIHMAGLSQPLPFSLKNIYEQAGKDSFDVVHIHPYVNPLMPSALDDLSSLYQTVRKTMEYYGDEDKAIWFSELGCPGMQNPGSTADWWLGTNLSEEQQAEWIHRVYGAPLRWENLQKVFWAFFRDTEDHFKTGVDSFGLIRKDFSTKPSFTAYQALARCKVP